MEQMYGLMGNMLQIGTNIGMQSNQDNAQGNFQDLLMECRQRVEQEYSRPQKSEAAKPADEPADKPLQEKPQAEAPQKVEEQPVYDGEVGAPIVMMALNIVSVEQVQVAPQMQQSMPQNVVQMPQQMQNQPQQMVQQAAEQQVQNQPQQQIMQNAARLQNQPQQQVQQTAEQQVQVQEKPQMVQDVQVQNQADGEADAEAKNEQQNGAPLFKVVDAIPVKVAEPAKLPADVAEQVQTQLEPKLAEALKNGESKVQIVLEPASLGVVKAEITQGATGELRIVLSADNLPVRELLEKSLTGLQTMLADRGYQTVNVEVQRHQDAQGDQNGQNENFEREGGRGNQQQEQRRQAQQNDDFLQQLRLGLVSLEELSEVV